MNVPLRNEDLVLAIQRQRIKHGLKIVVWMSLVLVSDIARSVESTIVRVRTSLFRLPLASWSAHGTEGLRSSTMGIGVGCPRLSSPHILLASTLRRIIR